MKQHDQLLEVKEVFPNSIYMNAIRNRCYRHQTKRHDDQLPEILKSQRKAKYRILKKMHYVC